MRFILSKFITPEQFGFFPNRQIHEVVVIAEECMHSIHTKHISVGIMKVDLQKTYDYVDWGYLRMVLFM